MKKVLSIVAATAMIALVACGPSEADKKAAADKAMQDSVAMADSLASAEAAAASAMVDSTKVDSGAAVVAEEVK
ncbi:MAG: hypothetical protein EXR20_06670 [Bacteroidetes bacterium]|nr:hypothetical protein [Bacteroidota bacterium]